MKKLLLMTTYALLAAVALSAQTPAPSASKPAGLGKQTTGTSTEDANVKAYMDLLRTDLKKGAAQIMGEVMALDTDQATKFWPIYKEFSTERTVFGDKIIAMLKDYADNYASMTDAKADKLMVQLLAVETGRTELKKKYYQRMKTALGATTAARFIQVENQIERLVDLQVASQLPVMGLP